MNIFSFIAGSVLLIGCLATLICLIMKTLRQPYSSREKHKLIAFNLAMGVPLIIASVILLTSCAVPDHQPMSDFERAEVIREQEEYVYKTRDDWHHYTVTKRPGEEIRNYE
jgi:hypothetical protein